MSAKYLFAAITAAAAVGAGFSAQAASAEGFAAGADQVSVRVSLADLDLSRQAGASAALQRIRAAAKDVCGDVQQIDGLGRYIPYVACLRSTVADARTSLDAQVAQNSRAAILLSRR